MRTAAFAGFSADTPLRPHQIERREPGPTDVAIAIQFCGVCHSDLHTVKSEWNVPSYPCVPGHEMVGKVTQVGAEVNDFRVGDTVGVGCMVDSCHDCVECRAGLEQFCKKGATFTYDSVDKHLGGVTYGGYSAAIVVDQSFVLRIPASLDLAAAAPLLCAGITMYSPLRHWKVGSGSTVGIVGLGGLGHMGIKLAHAMGAEVVLYTTSAHKAADATRLGASAVVLSTDRAAMKQRVGTLDLILNSVSVPHNLDPFITQLGRDGTMVMLGVPPSPHPSAAIGPFINKRRSLAGSLIGGIRETQEMLDFCAEHKVVSDIEIIPMQGINEAYERMLRSDVKYRFVIAMGTI